MAPKIRHAIASDYEACCELFEQVDASHRENLPSRYRRPRGPSRDLDYFAGILAHPRVALFVAEAGKAGKEIAGLAQVEIKETASNPILVQRKYAIVDTLVVSVPYRANGIGRALMNAVERWAKDNGAMDLELTVYEFNAGAIAFYEALGYGSLHRKMSKHL